jgi:small subunit ribosomal protein S20
MPTTDSAEKRVRQNEKQRRRNRSWKTQVSNDRKAVEDAIENEEDEETVQERLNKAISSIDRAVSKGVYHVNKGGRLKSQLHRRVNEYLGE